MAVFTSGSSPWFLRGKSSGHHNIDVGIFLFGSESGRDIYRDYGFRIAIKP